MILETDWTTAWLMTGLGVGVVFSILVLLVLVLQIFSFVAKGKKVKPQTAKVAQASTAPQSLDGASDIEKAAVATAVYLYLNNLHDEESGKLTIHLNEHTGWHAVLNNAI